MIVTEIEFPRRTDHSVRRSPVRLPRGDFESARKHRARKCNHNEVAYLEVRCTTDDPANATVGFANINLAEPDGLLEFAEKLDLVDPTDHNRPGHVSDDVDGLDLESKRYEGSCQVAATDIGRQFNKFAQPRDWCSHP